MAARRGRPGRGRELAQRGTGADEVVEGIRERGGSAEAFVADVTEEREVAELVAAVETGPGAIDVLVLNATGPQPEGRVAEVTWEHHLAQLEFFVKSTVLLGRAVLPGMTAKGARGS